LFRFIRPLSACADPENLRFHTVSNRAITDLMVLSHPFGGSRHGQKRN
jgi:hypothetical protein